MTRSRSWSRPAASRSATWRAMRTGVTTWRVTSQLTPATSTSISTPAVSSARVTSAHRALLLVEREQEVDRVGAAVGRQRIWAPTAMPGSWLITSPSPSVRAIEV